MKDVFDYGQSVLVLGKTGMGKTFSLRNLEPKSTIIIMTDYKPLNLSGWRKNYVIFNKNNKPNEKQGIIYIADTEEKLKNAIKNFTKIEYAKRFKNIIIDDFQFVSQKNIFGNMELKGFDKWVELAFMQFNILEDCLEIPKINGQNLIIMWHSNTDTETEDRGSRVKTGSKSLDKYLTVESRFSSVIEAFKVNGEYKFKTNSEESNEFLKSPYGALELYEPNDMKIILDKLEKFDKGE
jgi:hypothetical protein